MLTAGDSLVFEQRRTGLPVLREPEGVVAILSEGAQVGATSLQVEDAGRIDASPSARLLIQRRDGGNREVHFITSVSGNRVNLRTPLRSSYLALDYLVQDEGEIAAALGPGTVLESVVDSYPKLSGWGKRTAAIVSAIALGAPSAGVAAADALREVEPASPRQP
jgi:hypothetical protein